MNLRVGDCPEAFLSGSLKLSTKNTQKLFVFLHFSQTHIPNLKLHPLAVDNDRSYFEVYTDCCNVTATECVVGESYEQWTFADTWKSEREKQNV